MLPRVLKNFVLFIDGQGYGGRADEIILPKLTLKTEEHQAGGMDIPIEIEMGMEKLDLEFTLSEFNPTVLALWGLTKNSYKPLTLRGSLENDNDSQKLIIQMRGLVREIDSGTIKTTEKTQCKFTVNLKYYKVTFDNSDIIEIDIDNMVRKINGQDQLAQRRVNLGI